MAIDVKCVAVVDFGADVGAAAVATFIVIMFLFAAAAFCSLLFSSRHRCGLFRFSSRLFSPSLSLSLLLLLLFFFFFFVCSLVCVGVLFGFLLGLFLLSQSISPSLLVSPLFLVCMHLCMFVTTYLHSCGLLVLLLT